MPNVSKEDYITAIYRIQKSGKRVTTSALAGELGISSASVTDMIKKLSHEGYLAYEPYQGVSLKPKGEAAALKIIRRHRLWEMFLVKHLGYSWENVHEEADRLEHVTSNELDRRLDEFLGHPTVDPHGDPIPSVEGKLHKSSSRPLTQCSVGDIVRVVRVRDQQPEVLKHIATMGIGLDTSVQVKEVVTFDGTVRILIKKKEHLLSKQLAANIYVDQG